MYKRLPDSELEVMLVIWEAKEAVTRSYIEQRLPNQTLSPTTVLSFLSRLEEKGFVKVEKQGKKNLYTALISEQCYVEHEGKSMLEKLYGNSLKNFVASLYHGKAVDDKQMEELREYLDRERRPKE